MCVNVFQWLLCVFRISLATLSVSVQIHTHTLLLYVRVYEIQSYNKKNASLLLFFFFSSFLNFSQICTSFLIDTITLHTIYKGAALGLHTIQTISLSKTHFVCDNYEKFEFEKIFL